MLLHQFGGHLVFLTKLIFQLFDALGFLAFGILALGEGCYPVFKELLLMIKNRWLETVLIAQV